MEGYPRAPLFAEETVPTPKTELGDHRDEAPVVADDGDGRDDVSSVDGRGDYDSSPSVGVDKVSNFNGDLNYEVGGQQRQPNVDGNRQPEGFDFTLCVISLRVDVW